MGELEAELDDARRLIDAARKAGFDGVSEEDMERRLAEQLAAEREKRIEHTKQMAVRRIGKRDLTRGWVAWSDLYLEQRRRKNMLKAAGAKLTRPKLVASYSLWRRDWETETTSKAAMSIGEKLLLAEQERERLRAELAKTAEELDNARRAMLEGRGQEAELQRQMEERLEREREKRIEHTKEMALRRIGKRDLTRGWVAWFEKWAEEVRRKRTLIAAGNKLLRPKITAAYTKWRRDWEVEEHAKRSMSLEERLGQQVLDLTRQLQEAHAALGKAGTKEDQVRAPPRRSTSLSSRTSHVCVSRLACAPACRRMPLSPHRPIGRPLTRVTARQTLRQLLKGIADTMQAEKEKRIAHTQQMAVRRIGKRDLTRGWVAWSEMYLEQRRRKNMLKAAGARLTRPKLTASYHLWKSSWDDRRQAAKLLTLEGRLKVEVDRLQQELDEARRAMLDGRGLEAELQRQMEERLEREREKRIEHTKEMALRRIGKRDLSRGWIAWSEQYWERVRRKRTLKAAGNKLLRPKMTQAYSQWFRDWEAEERVKKSLSVSAQLNLQVKRTHALEAELQSLSDQLEEARKAMAEGRGQEAELKRQMEERMAAEKEKRIEHTKEMALKRIGKRDLTRGWVAWHEMWAEEARRKRTLTAAGAKLTKPKLVACYTKWRRDWELEEHSKASMTLEQRYNKEVKERAAAQQELAKLTHELAEAKQAMLNGRGMEHALQMQMEERLAAEREKRIAHTQEMAARRMGKRELYRGWCAWYEPWAEKRRRKRALMAASSRLLKPKLMGAYTRWRRDWEEEELRTRSMSTEERLGVQLIEMKAQLEAAQAELLKAKREGFGGGEMTADELERALAADREEQRLKRIEHTKQMAVRRIGKRDLTRGWVAWHEMWAEEARRKRTLMAAGAKLLRPKLVASYSYWRRGWEDEESKKSSMSMAQRLAMEVEERKRMQSDLGGEITRLKDELETARQAMLDGRGLEAEMERQLQERLARDKEKRIEHTKEMALRRIGKRDLTRGWVAWHEKWAEEARRKRMLSAAGSRLAKPKLAACYGHWKRDWELIEIRAKEMSAMSVEQRLRLQLVEAKQELSELRKAAQNGAGAEEALQRQLEERLEREREKRIEHTKQMALLRIMKKELARGWVAWSDAFWERQRRQRMLRNAGAKLTKPKLVNAYNFWRTDWTHEANAKKNMRLGSQTSRALREGEAAKRELAAVTAELEELRAATLEGRGTEHLREQQLEAELAAERQKRVEHIQFIAGKRLGNRSLAMGWSKWHADWAERCRRARVLTSAGAKLLRPKLVTSYGHWRRDWEIEVQATRSLSYAEQIKQAKRETHKLEAELQAVRDDLASMRASVADGRGHEELQRQKMQEELERERLKRVEHTQHMAIARLAKRELSRGWLGWAAPYRERMRRRRMLQAVGSKLLKPKLVRAYQHWHKDWKDTTWTRESMSLGEQLRLEQREREALAIRLQKIAREYQDQRQLDDIALQEARKQAADLQNQLAALLAEATAERQGATLAHAKVSMSAEDAAKARREATAAAELLKEQQKQAADHLAKQLADTRGTLEGQLTSARDEIRALKQQIADLEADRMRNKVRETNIKVERAPSPPKVEDDEEKQKRNRKGGILGEVDFDESLPLAPQIREALQKHAIRVLDLFREWDANGDGQISKKEFRKAMPMLGMDLPTKAIDELFDQYDPDKSGVMEFAELQKMLRKPASEASAVAAKGWGKAKGAQSAASKLKGLVKK